MARSLVFLVLFYVLGIVLGRYFFPLQLSVFLLAGTMLWALLNVFLGRGGLQALLPLLLLFLAVGSLACNLFMQEVEGNLRQFSGERCTLVGMVGDEPQWREEAVIFPLQLEKVILQGEEKHASGRVRVALRLEGAGREQDEAGASRGTAGFLPDNEWNETREALPLSLTYGQKISVEGVLYEPGEKRNPGGFDYRGFLETQGIGAVCYGSTEDTVCLGPSPVLSPFRSTALQVKERMSEMLKTSLPFREGNLLAGMLFGERSALDPHTQLMFQNSGISHLLALSGLHVGLLAAAIWLGCRRLGLHGWPLFFFTLLFLFFYVYMTGLRPSALRAFVMFALGMAALNLGRERDLPNALALAALIALVYNPLLLFTAGFQLSYAATGAIIALTPFLFSRAVLLFTPLTERVSWFPAEKLASLLAVTVAAQLGVLPLTAYYFGEVSTVALAANLLVLPAMSLVLGIGFLAALVGLLLPGAASFLLLAAYPLLLYLLQVAGGLGSLPFSSHPVFPPPLFLLLACYGFLFFLLTGGKALLFSHFSRWRKKVRPAHVFLALLLLAVTAAWPAHLLGGEKNLEVVFLDVGQGDAAFISTPRGKKVLIDGGGRPAFTGDVEGVGHRIVLPFLRERRVRELDLVVVSHPHEDHYGGLIPVLESLPVKLFVTNEDEPDTFTYRYLLELAEQKSVHREILTAGDSLQLERGVVLDVLAPPPEPFRGTGSDINNNSLVMRLSYREASVLFTGDIEEAAVTSLLEEGLLGPSQVLKVPHHGGYLPNVAWLLEAVQPEVAVIPVGNNSFGHPHTQTMEALAERGVEIYRTDLHGAVHLRTDGSGWNIDTVLKPPEEAFSSGTGYMREAVAR